MFSKVVILLMASVLLLQACMLAFLFQHGFHSSAAFTLLVFAVSVLVIIFTNKNLFDLAKQDPLIFNDAKKEINLTPDQELDFDSALYMPMMKWRSEYSHPLTLTQSVSQFGTLILAQKKSG
mmetsp:Transcript_7224/g.5487  ORF Transcript_7224/g.5487 Transcript_7224/m.5487 type:complete len:122 (-) Transcript_7224:453-818(-)